MPPNAVYPWPPSYPERAAEEASISLPSSL
jgi:hypothetical protein